MASTTATYRKLLNEVLLRGEHVSPRGIPTREIVNYTTSISMEDPVVNIQSRQASKSFMLGEAGWVLSGDSLLNEQVQKLAPFSDDGLTMAGAYGPRILMQVPYIVDKLREDRDTRQAVMHIHNVNQYKSHDTPCTLTLVFFIRDDYLNLHVTMRSSDAILGVCYDWFTFSCVAAFVAKLFNQVEKKQTNVLLGTLHWCAVSQHLYERDIELAQKLINDIEPQWEVIGRLNSHGKASEFRSFLQTQFHKPMDKTKVYLC